MAPTPQPPEAEIEAGRPTIAQYGWSAALAEAFAEYGEAGLIPGRVVVQQRDGYLVVTDDGEVRAKAAGRLYHEAEEGVAPAVGDWVALSLEAEGRGATVQAVLPRRTAFIRRAADSLRGLQVIAANIDVVFVVTSLNADLNPRRIERALAAAWQSGARPVVVLTKADLHDDAEGEADTVAAMAKDCPVLTVSAREGVGLEALLAQVKVGETCVLIGSSGVGKSTLVNAFLGREKMATQPIRDTDDKGRHSTSHRELVLLPGGGLILDTPGIREVGLIDADEGMSAVFDDIEALIQTCRFNDCSHSSEPGCAVQAGLEDGSLDAARWINFLKLGAELATVEAKAQRMAHDAERRRLAGLSKAYKATKKNNRGGRGD